MEARLHARSEQRLHGVIERALQIAERDVRVDRQAFDLMEYRRVRGVRGHRCGALFLGHTMRTGGFIFCMVRICTGEVWVRSKRRSRCGLESCPAMNIVSWVSRAGWLGGKFNASKL